jgi:hypothetical protein
MAIDPFESMPADQAAAYSAFSVSRAHAIASYSQLEQFVFRLFTCLSGMEEFEAGVIFFKINNVRSIVGMLDKLKRHKHGSAYNLAFNSTMKALKLIAEERNEIVHWGARLNTVRDQSGDKVDVFYTLTKPSFWESVAPNAPEWTQRDIDGFSERCAYVLPAVYTLTAAFAGALDQAEPLPDILQQQLAYPPPHIPRPARNLTVR